jgi:hypothetical protein
MARKIAVKRTNAVGTSKTVRMPHTCTMVPAACNWAPTGPRSVSDTTWCRQPGRSRLASTSRFNINSAPPICKLMMMWQIEITESRKSN